MEDKMIFLIELKNVDPNFAGEIAKEFKTVASRTGKKTILKIKDVNILLPLIGYLNKIKIESYIQCVGE